MGDPLCVNVTILADDTLEDNETFTVSIMSLSDNSDVLEPSDITITIVDEDGMCVHVCVCACVCMCVNVCAVWMRIESTQIIINSK